MAWPEGQAGFRYRTICCERQEWCRRDPQCGGLALASRLLAKGPTLSLVGLKQINDSLKLRLLSRTLLAAGECIRPPHSVPRALRRLRRSGVTAAQQGAANRRSGGCSRTPTSQAPVPPQSVAYRDPRLPIDGESPMAGMIFVAKALGDYSVEVSRVQFIPPALCL